MSEPRPRPARVIRLDARGCLVRLDEKLGEDAGAAAGRETLWCGVRGRIHREDRRHQKSPVAVGDRVDVIATGEDRGAVVGLHARRSTLSRPAIGRGRVEHVMAANVDEVVIVSSVAEPPFNAGLVDRILAVVAFSRLEAVLVLNKMDLGDRPEEAAVYESMGYPLLETSAATGAGVEALRERLAGRVSVVCGHSGVGKSSLLNAVQDDLGLAVGVVNPVTTRGKHTTTAAVWIDLAGGGAVIDTAGVREFGLYGIPRRDVPWLFPDLAAVAPSCRFPDCLHVDEPGCAVGPAVEAGRIAPFRYASYLRILEGLDAPQP